MTNLLIETATGGHSENRLVDSELSPIGGQALVVECVLILIEHIVRRPELADARSRLRELCGSRGVRVNLGQRKIAKDEEQIAAKGALNRLEDGKGFSRSRRIRSASPAHRAVRSNDQSP